MRNAVDYEQGPTQYMQKSNCLNKGWEIPVQINKVCWSVPLAWWSHRWVCQLPLCRLSRFSCWSGNVKSPTFRTMPLLARWPSRLSFGWKDCHLASLASWMHAESHVLCYVQIFSEQLQIWISFHLSHKTLDFFLFVLEDFLINISSWTSLKDSRKEPDHRITIAVAHKFPTSQEEVREDIIYGCPSRIGGEPASIQIMYIQIMYILMIWNNDNVALSCEVTVLLRMDRFWLWDEKDVFRQLNMHLERFNFKFYFWINRSPILDRLGGGSWGRASYSRLRSYFALTIALGNERSLPRLRVKTPRQPHHIGRDV